MADEIRVGTELSDYRRRTGEILEIIEKAHETAKECECIITDTEVYYGAATELIETFFSSLTAHLYRFQLLYETAERYLKEADVEYQHNEEQISACLEKGIEAYRM